MQPHTSAGRIPTDHGYRYFVDHFTRAAARCPRRSAGRSPTSSHVGAPRARGPAPRDQPAARRASARHAAVVVGPQPDAAQVRSVQLVLLQPERRARDRGAVERRDREARLSSSPTTSRRARRRARRPRCSTPQLARVARWGRSRRSAPTGDPDVDRARACTRATRSPAAARTSSAEPLYVGGASRLAAEQEAFPTRESARTPARDARAPGRSSSRSCATCSTRASPSRSAPRTGSTSCATARSCSRPTASTGRSAGTVGVLGPTRMDYRQALAAVAAVSNSSGAAPVVTRLLRDPRRRPQRDRRRDQARVPRPGRGSYHPDNNPGDPDGRGAVQGGQRRLRDAARPRAPPPLRRVRRRRPRRRERRRPDR